jgi:hypothetical protein
MSNDDKQRKAYDFLLRYAKSQEQFTAEELGVYVGWENTTPSTNLGKQFKSVVSKEGKLYRVKRQFIHLDEEEFVKRTSQKEHILPSYKRTSYNSVLFYEFLMPLTREDLLKQALDSLFFKNTLLDKLKSLGLDSFYSVLPRRTGESDDIYGGRIAAEVSKYFGGYSITHANGRFRADALLTQTEALGKRYIIDETTAVVRFIIPLNSTRTSHSPIFDPRIIHKQISPDATINEVALVRTLFFTVFAEVVVHSVQGEDEIWLLEALNGEQRLYKWSVED